MLITWSMSMRSSCLVSAPQNFFRLPSAGLEVFLQVWNILSSAAKSGLPLARGVWCGLFWLALSWFLFCHESSRGYRIFHRRSNGRNIWPPGVQIGRCFSSQVE